VDPISHAFFGRLLVGHRKHRGLAAAAVLGALSPDLDAVLMPVGWDLYLRIHQLGTHALVGTVGCAALVATVVHLRSPQSRWRLLALAAWVGALSHVFLDLVSSATVRPWWPFSNAAARFGLVAMADPFLAMIILIAGLIFWRWPARRLNTAITGLVLVLLMLAGKGIVRAEAQRLYAAATRGEPVQAQILEPEWGTISRWVAIDRTQDRVRRWDIDTSRSTVSRNLDLPLGAGTQPATASESAAVVRNLLAAHDFPIAVAAGSDDAPEVRWSDLQYCQNDAAPTVRLRALRDGGQGRLPAGTPSLTTAGVSCALWFGVALDSHGSIANEFVTIGSWVQTR
jgi:membrane-bound metal-dependent hydrolase YbcI (DUF457 family)